MASDTIVHVPAAGNTPPAAGTSELTLPRATDQKLSVNLSTVHNWVELVYKAFGQTLPTGAKELALLGVREALISNKDSKLDPTNSKASEGDSSTGSYKKISRDESMAHRTTWDDLLFAAYTDNEKEDSQHVDVYQCSIDPVKGLNGAGGTPYVLEGKLYRGYPSYHSEQKGNVALHLYSSAKEHIQIAREAKNLIRTFKTLDQARVIAKDGFARGEFVREENNDTVHVHFARGSLNTSVGCTVLAHMIQTARYQNFMKTFNAAPNKQKIPYIIVSSQYVRLYDDWVKSIDAAKSSNPGPETVIMKDQLRSPKGISGQYLPSIMTTEFANAIIDSGSDKDGPAMRKSLEKALFTVAF